MKYIYLLTISILFFSCGKDKVVKLPEINTSEISEINDVSAAYLFYDETKADSVDLNRKNLISTTNWLVNIDKRLTLKQVIPHIKFLQEKKANAGHKNEHAKNYFTCHDISKNNLGFIEFTNLVYNNTNTLSNLKASPNEIIVNFNTSNIIRVINFKLDTVSKKTTKNNLAKTIKPFDVPENTIKLHFNSNLLFQDYITYKEHIITKIKHAKISPIEFIYN